jgi:cation transport ATPase
MIHLGILLVVGGVASALMREYKKKQRAVPTLSLPAAESQDQTKIPSVSETKVFDDVGELEHYQKVSWYALAFSTSGAWFYPPATLVSIPLLGYNTYHFIKTIRESDKSEQTAPMTIFEIIAVTGTLVTGRPVTASVLMLLSFGTRKLLLRVGNITNNIGLTQSFNPRFAKVWTLRDGAEIETPVTDLQEGDIVVLHAGETVVVAGKVLEGSGAMRQFSLRKQMKLIPKQTGDSVFPFTQLESGCLHIQPK